MGSRVKVVHADVMSVPELLTSADVIVLNNVFEFFAASPEDEINAWAFLATHASPGALLVVTPSLDETGERLGKAVASSFRQWVRPLPPRREWMDPVDDDEDMSIISLYQVVRKML